MMEESASGHKHSASVPIHEVVPVAQPQAEDAVGVHNGIGGPGRMQHPDLAERADAAPHAEEGHVIPQGGVPLQPVEPRAISVGSILTRWTYEVNGGSSSPTSAGMAWSSTVVVVMACPPCAPP